MKKRILFVDDEPNVLEGLRRMLISEQERWDMSFVCDAETAIGRMHASEFDAVVADVTMPQRDGIALLAEIRSDERLRRVPVIILTGRRDRELKRLALDLGATDLLTKPIHAEDLIARLRNAIRLKGVQDELRLQNDILESKVKGRTTR